MTNKMRFIRIVVCCLILSIVPSLPFGNERREVYGQGRAESETARKFDEYKLGLDFHVDQARLVRFARQLKAEPSTKAFIIAYSPRLRDVEGSSHWFIAENRLLTTKVELADRYGVPERRIIALDGGIREDATVEFWILPAGASPPTPRSEFQTRDIVQCHGALLVSGDIYVPSRNSPLKFSAGFGLGTPAPNVSFQWSVSSGKILSGQGTATITVDAGKATEKNITATAVAVGLPAECLNQGSHTTVAGALPHKLFEFAENFSEALKIRFDLLAEVLQKHPELQAHIIVYGGRRGRRHHVAHRSGYAQMYLTNSRGVTTDRYRIVAGGYREEAQFEIWLVRPGATLPAATPSVDEKYVRFIDPVQTSRKRQRRD